MSRAPVVAAVRVKVFPLIAEALSTAVRLGIARAQKHGPATDEGLHEAIEREVLNALCEVLDFGD